MSKVLTTAIIAAIAVASTSAHDSCVLVDFTAQKSEFDDLNAAIDLVKSTNVVDSMLGKYDPLILNDTTLGEFSYSVLGQDVTIIPTIDSMKVTGLSTLALQHVNVTSSNRVDVGVYSDDTISVHATLSVSIKELHATATAKVALGFDKPICTTNIETDTYTCAPGVPTSSCSNVTIMDIESKVVSASNGGSYSSVVKEVLTKFKDASVQSFTLDFASVSTFDITFDSSNIVFSSIAGVLADYSADEINKKEGVYDSVISKVNEKVPGLLNDLIDSKLKSQFGATCLSEK